jgi:prepilin-type N-terminal cleavage/methylation domain-containing protein
MSLVELMIVIAIIGILAAIVAPKFTSMSEEAVDSTVRNQLRILRSEIVAFEAAASRRFSPAGATGWDDLRNAGLLKQSPRNPLFGNASSIAAAPAGGVGWLWTENPPGDPETLNVYAVDATGAAIYPE